jgi:hypothetical protein
VLFLVLLENALDLLHFELHFLGLAIILHVNIYGRRSIHNWSAG